MREVIGILIKPVSKGRLGEDLEILRSVLFARSSSVPHKEDNHGFQIRYVIYSFFSIKMMLCVLPW